MGSKLWLCSQIVSVSWFQCVTHFVVHLDFICGTSTWCSEIASGVSLAWPEIRSHHKVIDAKGNWLMPLRRFTGRYCRKHGLFG